MNSRLLYFVPAFVFLSTIDFSFMLAHTVHFIFQARDMARAAALVAGSPIFFGPEMTGGGNLPGPLYYFLLALPQTLSSDWRTAWYFMVGLGAVGAVVGWSYLRTRFSSAAAAVWVVIFASSVSVYRLFLSFLNIGFILPFAIGAFVALFLGLTAKADKERRNSYFGGALLSGLAVQLHFSTVTFLIGFWLAQALGPLLGVKRLSPKILLIGLGFFALPMVPYFIFLIGLSGGQALGQDPFFAGEAASALPSLWLLIEFAMQFSAAELALSLASKVVESLPWMLVPLAMTIWLVPVTGAKNDDYGRWLKPLLFMMAVAAVPFSYWTFATIGIRYAVVFSLTGTFLAAFLFSSIATRPRRLEIYTFLTAAFALGTAIWFWEVTPFPLSPRDYARFAISIFAPLFLFAVSDRMGLRKGLPIIAAIAASVALATVQKEFGRIAYFYNEPRLMLLSSQWEEMWRHVYEKTGWSFEEAMRRLYFVNHHLERDAGMSFNSATRATRPQPPADLPDGFFVAFNQSTRLFTALDFKNWLMEQNIPEEIKEGLRTDEIRVLERYSPDLAVWPYTVNKPKLVPRFFHNNGQGYFRSANDDLLREITEPEGVRLLSDGRLLFKWNECPSRHPYCDTGAVVKVEQNQIGSMHLTIDIFGPSISQSSPWISPTWTQRWVKPFVEVQCGGREFRFPIAESIGYSRKYSAVPGHVLLWGNNSIIAPFSREFDFPCGKDAGQIGVGREGSEVETLHEVKKLPGAKLSVHL